MLYLHMYIHTDNYAFESLMATLHFSFVNSTSPARQRAQGRHLTTVPTSNLADPLKHTPVCSFLLLIIGPILLLLRHHNSS